MTRATEWDRLLESYPAAVRVLARRTRALVLSVIPGAEETVDARARVIGYGFGSGYAGVVCTIIVSRTGVKLGIVRGAELPDPLKLLRGSGKVHRHVPIEDAADLAKPGVGSLLEAGFAAWKRRTEEGTGAASPRGAARASGRAPRAASDRRTDRRR
jgi:hypothetical protein